MSGARSLWRVAATPLIVSRVLIAVMVVLSLALAVHSAHPFTAAPTSLVHWDAVTYLHLAAAGYPAAPDYRDAFLPGFPLLIRVAAAVTRDFVSAALVVTLAAEAIALWFVARMVAAERDLQAARFCVFMLAFFPTAIFLTAPFTEAPFIAAAAAALYFGRQGRALPACAAAAAAASFRLTGLALLPALALELSMRTHWRPRREHLALLLIPLPLLLYCAYMQAHTGDALALFHAEASPSFGQSPAAPWDGFLTTWNTMLTARDGEIRSIFAREVAFGLLGLVACAGMWASTRVPRSLALYCSAAWLMTASLSFWRSEPRYVLALFPALILVADLTSRARALRPALVAVSAVLMCAGAGIFAQGRWVG